jgi:3-methylcrotonyl-CoA carboxylase alpha subunit
MFERILIANRGEIACRIAATARRLGIATVAVYSDADREAAHVAACDEAWRVGPPPARESYLRADRLIEIALERRAQAIHPGYGFLSENESFAQAVVDAGLVFIGPPAAAIAAMGSKSAAKALMERAGVPLVPGYHGERQQAEYLRGQADAIGYPVLIKASAGGGGKGMRIVQASADFEAALASCRREALAAFGDDRVLVERYLQRPRHIEIQVFADRHGQCLSLFERDCSIQRRHQKVIEEAPAPGMDAARRAAMGDAAVAAARAVGYEGAGTVEFIAEPDGRFYFMEMNTRLQVEHPVTEMITGQDLVEWQLRVAAGEPLPVAAEQLSITGHAIEVRLYAEQPERGFLPSIGRIEHLRLPEASAFAIKDRAGGRAAVRIDAGVRAGDTITPHYDPMIAKLICWGQDRAQAIARMRQALAQVELAGPACNAALLARLMEEPDFVAGRLDTGLIERERAGLLPEAPASADARTRAIAAAAVLWRDRPAPPATDWSDPWGRHDGWRAFGNGRARLRLIELAQGTTLDLAIEYLRDGSIRILDGEVQLSLSDILADPGGARLSGVIDGERFRVSVCWSGSTLHLFDTGSHHRFTASRGDEAADGDAALEGSAAGLSAPMPGKVIELKVAEGDEVTAGQPLMVLEAMKMEHTISAPRAGCVVRLHAALGEQVLEGAPLIAIGPPGERTSAPPEEVQP